MKRCALALLAAAFAAAAAAAPPDPAERRLAFAQKLHADGEKAFALLEYKRFLFHHGDHPRAVDAALAAARLYVGYLKDLDGARRTLKELAAARPRTEAETRARQMLTFLEVNSDYQAEPLALFLAAVDDESLGRNAAAAASYALLAGKYPKARLADDALLREGRLRLEALKQPPQAQAALEKLLRQYPRSEHVPEAAYYRAAAMEKQHGPTAQVVGEYRRVARTWPDTEAARLAAARLAAIEKSRYVLRRQYDRASVRPYTVLRAGYLHSPDQYVVRIKVAANLSERELKATLEDALLAHSPKRSRASDSVHVTAYATYPGDQVGSVAWSPEGPPQYQLPRPGRKGDELLKDVLIDILRKI